MNKLKRFIQFINHIVITLSLVRNNYLKIGKWHVILAYFKICLYYIFAEIALGKKIKKIVVFGHELETPNFRLFITVFESVFIFDEYFFETKKKDPIIVDCGANIGVSILYFKLLYPESKVIAIEPHPIIFGTITNNTEANNWRNTELINGALSNRSGKINFFYNLKESGSLTASTIESRVPQNRKSVAIDAVKLSSVLKDYRIIDFLKMDIEGAEEKVIPELHKSGEIKKIRQAVIEYHHHINPEKYEFSKLLNILEKAKLNYMISTYKAYSPFIKGQYQDILIYAYRSKA